MSSPLIFRDDATLRFERTISRKLVHKSLLENVFITSIQSLSENRFVCGARLPRLHRFFNEPGRDPRSDLSFLTEVARQASIAVCHEHLSVRKGDHFVLSGLYTTLVSDFPAAGATRGSDRLFVDLRLPGVSTRRNGKLSRIVAEYSICDDDQTLFQMQGAWSVHGDRTYARLRQRSRGQGAGAAGPLPADAAEPSSLGRQWRENVVIERLREEVATGTLATRLVVDPLHPMFFDHDCDHVPGMLLYEAYIQTAILVACRSLDVAPSRVQVSCCEPRFERFAELDAPVEIRARVQKVVSEVTARPDLVLEVQARQAGGLLGSATLTAGLYDEARRA